MLEGEFDWKGKGGGGGVGGDFWRGGSGLLENNYYNSYLTYYLRAD